MAKGTIGNRNPPPAARMAARRANLQFPRGPQPRSPRGPPALPPGPPGPPSPPGPRGGGGGPPPDRRRPAIDGSRRGDVARRPFSAALTSSIDSRGSDVDGGPSSAALTSSIGSARRGDRSSTTAGRIVVNRSSGGT